jgi:hypothetical protein
MITVAEVTREVAPGRGRHAEGLVLVVLGPPQGPSACCKSLIIPVLPANLGTIGGALGGQVTDSIVTSGRRVLGYPGPGGYAVSLLIMVAASAAAAVVAATVPVTPRKAGLCLPP